MKKNFVLALFVSAAFFFSGAAVSFAGSSSPTVKVFSGCPFYDSRNVRVSLEASKPSASLGSIFSFSAGIENSNSFSVPDVSLFVIITGPEGRVYDKFVADTGNIILPAGGDNTAGRTGANFSWKTPAFAVPGVYTARVYVISVGQFYVGGVVFADDLPAGQVIFSLAGENKKFVSFTSPVLAGSGMTGASEPVSFSAVIDHNLDDSTEALVVWKAYARNAASEKNIVESAVEKVILVPGEAVESKFSMKDASVPEYDVVAEVGWMDAKSFASGHIRRQGLSGANFSLVSFSPDQGVMVCLDNILAAGDGGGFPKTVKVEARNEKDKKIESESFQIGERESVVGFIEPVSGIYSILNIKATVFDKNGREQASANIIYDCDALASDECAAEKSPPYLAIVAFFGGLVAVWFIARLSRKFQQSNFPNNEIK